MLLEFQSRDDRYMALRILSYTSLLYQELVRNQASEASRWLPAVVPVVPYNGTAPEPATARAWRAPARRRRGCGCARRGVPGTVPPPGL